MFKNLEEKKVMSFLVLTAPQLNMSLEMFVLGTHTWGFTTWLVYLIAISLPILAT